MSMSSLQYTILKCQEYIFSAVKAQPISAMSSKTINSKAPVALQQVKTKKVLWTLKDD